MLVLNKPPGLATQGGSGTFQHVDGLLDAYADEGPRPRLVHRLDKDTSGVLLIALSGYGMPDDRRRSLDAGFDMHVTKPVDMAELLRSIAEWPAPATR